MILRAACALILLLQLASHAHAEIRLRIATFDTELQRDGPGILLRDLLRGSDPQVQAVIDVITRVSPDILLLQGIDWDHDNRTLGSLVQALKHEGLSYPYQFTARPNSGLATDLDLDGDGRTGTAKDAQGFGRFSGQGGMALLSRFPIDSNGIRDFSARLWKDIPDASMPTLGPGKPFPSEEVANLQRLSSIGHWVVPVQVTSSQTLSILAFKASPPVFDGPEDRNGRRNHDEIGFWKHYLDGAFGPVPRGPFAIVGNANLDPEDGEGRTEAITRLLQDPRLQDPAPESNGAASAGNQGHRGNDSNDTVDWPGIGRFRVDYVLPSSEVTILDSGVFWPAIGQPGRASALQASRHRLVWVDLTLN